MAECRDQQAPRQVGLWCKPDALAERSGCRIVLAGDKVGRAKEVYILLGINWIETDCSLKKWDRCQRITRVDLGGATGSVGLRVVRVKRQRDLTLSLRSFEVPFPSSHSSRNPMRKSYFRALLHCKVREMLCDIEQIWRAGQMIMEVEEVRPAEASISLRVVGIEFDRAPHERDDR